MALLSLMACGDANKPEIPANNSKSSEVADIATISDYEHNDVVQKNKLDTLQWIVILLIALGAFGYVVYNNKKPKDENERRQRKSDAEPKIIAGNKITKKNSNSKPTPEPEAENPQHGQVKESDNGLKTNEKEHEEAIPAETKDTDKAENAIPETKQAVEAKPAAEMKKILYVNEKFNIQDTSFDRSFHFFKLALDADGSSGSFEFYDNECKGRFIKTLNEDVRDITCEINGYGTPDTLVMLQPGRARIENDKWVVDKRMVLEYK